MKLSAFDRYLNEKDAFRRHVGMPINGLEHMKGTAFYWLYNNVLFVSVDVFEEGKGTQGGIVAQVSGKQLLWLEDVLNTHHEGVDHIVVMGHTPILKPARVFSASAIVLEKGRDSDLWKTLIKYHVDLYICGETHAINCEQKDGVQHVSHGALIGRATKANYMVVTVSKTRLELEFKGIDLI